MSGKVKWPRELGLIPCTSRTLHLLPFSKLHFRSPSFHGGAPCGFPHFWLIFNVFMHIWQHPLRVLRFEFVLYIGQLVLWFHWLGTIPIHGVFGFIYHSIIFAFHWSLKSIFCSCFAFLEFKSQGFWFCFCDSKIVVSNCSFPCLANFVYWLLDEKCNQALRLCLLVKFAMSLCSNSGMHCDESVCA